MEITQAPSKHLKSSFHAKFINPTTVLILEDDIYLEQPLIYVKIYTYFLLITDTGTAHPRNPSSTSLTLLQFLETVPITPFSSKTQQPKPQPLNPKGKKRYLILCTHAHYDHILGIPSFSDAQPPPLIIASGNDPSFILEDLPTHSLCKYLDNVPTPVYEVSHWTKHLEFLPHPDLVEGEGVIEEEIPLRIRCLHIPGHTVDSLAWYDIDEGYLFVGDMFYARKGSCIMEEFGDGLDDELPEQDAAILFPAEGNWTHYMASLDLIISFVEFENQRLKSRSKEMHVPVQRVKVGCGHVTFAGDAEDMVREVKGLFMRILEGKVEVVKSFVKRGEVFDIWDEGGESKYFVGAPRRLCEEATRRM